MLYLLHFLFLSDFKPTNVFDGGAFSQDIFSFEFLASPIKRFNVAKFCAQTSYNLKNYKHWYHFHCWERYKLINALDDAVITAKVCSL